MVFLYQKVFCCWCVFKVFSTVRNSLEFATKEWQKHEKMVLLAVDRPQQQATKQQLRGISKREIEELKRIGKANQWVENLVWDFVKSIWAVKYLMRWGKDTWQSRHWRNWWIRFLKTRCLRHPSVSSSFLCFFEDLISFIDYFDFWTLFSSFSKKPRKPRVVNRHMLPIQFAAEELRSDYDFMRLNCNQMKMGNLFQEAKVYAGLICLLQVAGHPSWREMCGSCKWKHSCLP